MSAAPVLLLHPHDDLAVALRDLAAGDSVPVGGAEVVLRAPVAAKHKFALRNFRKGETAKLYGVTVGRAVRDIARGDWIHTGNLEHATQGCAVREARCEWIPPGVSRWAGATFDGYRRRDGRVGTANYWIVVPLVFCENRNLLTIRAALLDALGYSRAGPYQAFAQDLIHTWRSGGGPEALAALRLRDSGPNGPESGRRPLFPGVDGLQFLLHEGGCGGTQDDAQALCGLLAGYITHPNVAGATVLSLGCQHAQIALIEREIALREPGYDRPFLVFEQQKSRSERNMMEDAIRSTFLGIAGAGDSRREPAGLERLIAGMECGGSDGFSGISANPVIGAVADRLTALGASVILSEFPELCGVEQELADRCVTRELAARYLDLMARYQERAVAVGSGFHQNPSHGNIQDGLITDAMKSAGAAKKGGTAPVTDVLDYPGWITRPGLTLLCTPGNDVESTTAMAGAGANLMFFSTGLGTPTGNPVTPVIKISTTSELAKRLPDIIDFDAGAVIRGERSPDELGGELLDLCIAVASGRVQPAAVRLGQADFIPWKRGVSL
ncbi:MAG TPA: altronate dehydratase family protein [Verrucomicrobiales bacterium]|nr:altronate dehydratase family protein [Verrucomicrobiales bacterium]